MRRNTYSERLRKRNESMICTGQYHRKSLSQEALAQESGVPRRTLWGILSGKSRKGAGGPTYAVARRNETDLLTAIREEQARIGRHMTDSELDKFSREFYAPEYRAELRRLVALGVTDEEGEEE
jgi:hypothetical protein